MNYLHLLRQRLRDALTQLPGLTGSVEPYVDMLRPAQDRRFGDFQANCAMPLKGVLQRSPVEIARELVAGLQVGDVCRSVEIAGPGFINFTLSDESLAGATAALVPDERLGVPRVTEPKTVVIDFSGPNVAKPMHVGHLRSTVLGLALDRVLRFAGHRVISDNHIGDWGTQFGMILYGYKHFRDEAAYQRQPVAELARLYRLVNQLGDYHDLKRERPTLVATLATAERAAESARIAAEQKPQDKELARAAKKAAQDLSSARDELASCDKKLAAVDESPELSQLAAAHPQIGELARRETARLHAGDAENLTLWHQFLPQCLAALDHMYARLGVKFDLALGESYYNPQLAPLVETLLRDGLAEVSDGAVCIFAPGSRAPFIVRKADGAFTYATTDLATLQDRIGRLGAQEILYVVDARQSEHFQQLFATAQRMGYTGVQLRHISFGTILGSDRRPYKTRSGDTVGLESLLDEAVEQARDIVEQSDVVRDLPPDQRQEIAETVGLGGIFYADLHHNRESDYVFSWEKMLAKDGDTATYIQYAYARVNGIFRKGDVDIEALRAAGHPIVLTGPHERSLALQLNRLGEAIEDVLVDYRPNLLTQYLFETANLFAVFFDNCPVLREEHEDVRISRLLLCDLTARTLRLGLDLLGIRVAPQM